MSKDNELAKRWRDEAKLAEKWIKGDNINHPAHYTYGDIEVIDYCDQVCKQYPLMSVINILLIMLKVRFTLIA